MVRRPERNRAGADRNDRRIVMHRERGSLRSAATGTGCGHGNRMRALAERASRNGDIRAVTIKR